MIWYEVILRLILAIIVGGLIGYEREYKNRPAGFRTHILVCVGAAVISMIQLYSVQETTNIIVRQPVLASALKADIGRLGAQVITGVGFLGAGTIMHDKGSVKGLTTAASLWVVACIGLGVGLGYYFLTVSATVVVFLILVSLKQVETRFFQKSKIQKFEVQYVDKVELVTHMEEYFSSRSIKVQNIEFELDEEDESLNKISLYTVLVPRHIKSSEIIRDLCVYEGIIKVTLV
ncbi:MgtC/SapB family protein [Clostridium swellfunianum]|uniref:MgtC/SapB family protein n=1 Tax=Clostridium swellfunianum TaxID=1367462 RepID=UPI002030099F|nr:MgtC/SapB family protein [Clostridium swellfunianum]MCM0649497.1 MgtC/SapB family protein [Clostridium swellfunianum]